MAQRAWEFWIDRGGTFTDVVARDPEGALHVRKLLSEAPERYEDAPLAAIRDLLGLAPEAPIPAGAVRAVKMGTTLATNALLERKGARTALVVTAGFGDLLAIGNQDRPDIFALRIDKPTPLYEASVEARERVLHDGTVRQPLDESALHAELARLRAAGVESVAVLFLHSFAFPDHERAAGRIARSLGFGQVSLSHEAANEIKAVGRGDTTVVDAALTPLLLRYIARLRAALGPEAPLRFMQSNGGLVDAEGFSGKNAVLSGPAGGVVACAHVARLAGFPRVIGFDMGGTSTDVSRYDGRFEHVYESTVAGARLKAPMMAIETVAAGGGSILRFEDGRFLVGPESAGANPGPACYGRGGPAAVTDANLVLGRIQPDHFPRCFGPCGDEGLDAEAARAAIGRIAEAVRAHTGADWRVEAVAAGFVRVANENMVKPIKEISVGRGFRPRDYALACFGGAGGQHACAIADALDIQRILLHPLAGVLSAYGMGLADMMRPAMEAVLARYDDALMAHLADRFARIETAGAEALAAEGFPHGRIRHERALDMRYEGVDAYLNVPLDGAADPRTAFEEAHHARYGFTKAEHPVEVVNLRVTSIAETDKPEEPERDAPARDRASREAAAMAAVWFVTGAGGLEPAACPVFQREQLRPGDRIVGPALIIEPVATTVVDPGWRGEVTGRDHLVLARAETPGARAQAGAARDPVLLEVFNNRFMAIAAQMGQTLERVSHSTNIKERRDFSCAVFGAEGDLVANAPHIPVHLGAMSEAVKAVLTDCGEAMRPGDVYVTNDPYRGGSHLPDVTVVTPVFGEDGARRFFVANRGHHADIGGITPGSMPPFSRSIEEEGVVLRNLPLVRAGVFQEEAVLDALRAGPHPARNLDERMSDLRAQTAANATGARLLGALCAEHGAGTVRAYMAHVRDNAAETMAARLHELPDGEYRFIDAMDDGAAIACAVRIHGARATVDFTGTAPQHPGNLNAPAPVTLSAVLYVFRTLVGKPIPLNSGCLDPIDIVLPEGTMLSPRHPAAVVGGNVETSMRICDALYGALGVLAAGQGTMNNLSFGDGAFGYYETLCGGAGAGPDFDGADAVHTHMTNSRITDPEVLERRYPVMLRAFSIRRGSGGPGQRRGGDGVLREIEFLAPVTAGILSERRNTRPFGLEGGESGAPGRNTLLRIDPETGIRRAFPLPGHVQLELHPGDILRIETPGGGGYGRAV